MLRAERGAGRDPIERRFSSILLVVMTATIIMSVTTVTSMCGQRVVPDAAAGARRLAPLAHDPPRRRHQLGPLRHRGSRPPHRGEPALCCCCCC